MTRAAEPLLQVEGLTTDILTRTGRQWVVDDRSFEVAAGETLASVGESGSGKSLAMLSITGLLPSPPAKVIAGTARFAGRDLLALPPAELRRLRDDRIGMIFQEPMSALDPMAPVGDQIAETLVTHRGASWRAARRQAIALMTRVHIADAATRARQHAASISGGMRHRSPAACGSGPSLPPPSPASRRW
jgi:ABC-type microcin C transport system duplicated ATPase subunit YejF